MVSLVARSGSPAILYVLSGTCFRAAAPSGRGPTRLQGAFIQARIVGAALLDEREEARGRRLAPRPGALEAGRAPDVLVPVLRPDPVEIARAGGPGEHRRLPRKADVAAELAQDPFGIEQERPRVEDRRALSLGFE